MHYPDPISVEEYLEGEKLSEIRHEYVAGQVYAMAGGMDGRGIPRGRSTRSVETQGP